MVGNEVLLHRNMTASDLAATIRSVKAQVTVPVTYADVWEFWLRNCELYDAVDFVTVHSAERSSLPERPHDLIANRLD